eukprot:TRINITY_DN10253_c0_g4_i2.p1 TRINITY_DN10253_c0_g4~~TRINITY_DN10253_c0_g4_i2.p1  ORF type:complete len:106 (+),score=22.92 TRINITY_DN10253_c0_g4_i2:30-320(+)
MAESHDMTQVMDKAKAIAKEREEKLEKKIEDFKGQLQEKEEEMGEILTDKEKSVLKIYESVALRDRSGPAERKHCPKGASMVNLRTSLFDVRAQSD